MTTGIYKIENNINHKVYIGQSTNIEKRWKEHRSRPYDPKDHSYNTHLYRSIRKYGLEVFDFSIIEECPIEQLNEKERAWIAFYDSFFNGYNLTLGGDSSVGQKNSKEKVLGIIEDLRNTTMFHREIAEKWGVSIEMVQGINTGRYWKHDCDYPIQKCHQPSLITQKYYCCDCGKEISKNAKRCRACDNTYRAKQAPMPVQKEELKALIREKSFVEIGKQFNVSDNAIRRWCVKYNLPRTKNEIKKYTDQDWANL